MYNVDENFITCWSSKGRYDEVTGTMTLVDGSSVVLDLNEFCENTIKISAANTKDGKDILFGVVHANMLKMSIYTELDRYALFGADITLTYHVYNKRPVEGTEYLESVVELGKFTIADVEKNTGIASITAYDYMKKLDESFGTTVFSGTPHTILTSVSEKTGVPFDYTLTDMTQFLNYDNVVQFDSTSGLKTYRDIVSATCQMMGVCCRANKFTGGMELYKFSLTHDATIPATGWYLSQANIADYTVRFNGFSATSVKGTFKKVTRGIPGITMTIEDAPAWDYGIPESLRNRSVALADYITQLQYTPCDITIFNTPIYDCGDMLHIQVDNTYVNVLLTEIEWAFQAPVQIKSTGTNILLEKTAVEESSRQVTRGTDANKLVSYDVTNTDSITLHDQDTITLCDLSFTSAQATHAMWLANILLESEADTDYTDVKITYYYDNIEIEYYPQEHYIDGNHDFSLFFPISAIAEQSVHRWKVDITALNGDVTINQYDFRGTLFGQNLVEQSSSWDGILTLEDFIENITPITILNNITETSIVINLHSELKHVYQDNITAILLPVLGLHSLTEECIITLMYREDICFCGENYYAGTEGVLL